MSVVRSLTILLITAIVIVNGEEIDNESKQNSTVKEKREYLSGNTGSSNGFHYEKNAKTINAYAQQPLISQSSNILDGYKLQNSGGQIAGYGMQNSGGQVAGYGMQNSGGQIAGYEMQNSGDQMTGTHTGSLQPVYIMGDLSSLSRDGHSLDLRSLLTAAQSQLQGASQQNVGPIVFASTSTSEKMESTPSYTSNSQRHFQIPATSYGIPNYSTKIPINSFDKPLFTSNVLSNSYGLQNPSLSYGSSNYHEAPSQFSTDSLLSTLKLETGGQNMGSSSNLHSLSSNDNAVNYFGGHVLQVPLSTSNIQHNSLISGSGSTLNTPYFPKHIMPSFAATPSYAASGHLSFSRGPSASYESFSPSGVHLMLNSGGHESKSVMDYSHVLGPNIVNSNQFHIPSSSSGNSYHFPIQYMKMSDILKLAVDNIGGAHSHLSPLAQHFGRQSSEDFSKVYDTIKYSEPMNASGYLPK